MTLKSVLTGLLLAGAATTVAGQDDDSNNWQEMPDFGKYEEEGVKETFNCFQVSQIVGKTES